MFFLKNSGDEVIKQLSTRSKLWRKFFLVLSFKNSDEIESIYHEQILILLSLQYSNTVSLILKTCPISSKWGEKFLIVFKILSLNFFTGLKGWIIVLLDFK